MDGKKSGFACMDRDRQRAVASLGGVQSHRLGKAHRFTTAQAEAAAKKAHAMGRCHYFTHEEAVEAGRKGGRARALNRAKARMEEARETFLKTLSEMKGATP
jgi:uncharacterized protein